MKIQPWARTSKEPESYTQGSKGLLNTEAPMSSLILLCYLENHALGVKGCWDFAPLVNSTLQWLKYIRSYQAGVLPLSREWRRVGGVQVQRLEFSLHREDLPEWINEMNDGSSPCWGESLWWVLARVLERDPRVKSQIDHMIKKLKTGIYKIKQEKVQGQETHWIKGGTVTN